MDSWDTLIHQFLALGNGVFHADFELGCLVVLSRFESPGQLLRKRCSAQRDDPFDTSELGNRHDAGN